MSTIKKKKEYTGVYQNNLNDSDNHEGVIMNHLELDILECEVKWTLGSITTKIVEVIVFQLSYFKF